MVTQSLHPDPAADGGGHGVYSAPANGVPAPAHSAQNHPTELLPPGAARTNEMELARSDPHRALEIALAKGNCALYLGAGFTRSATGKDWSELVEGLGDKLAQCGAKPELWKDLDLLAKAQLVEDVLGRKALVDEVRKACTLKREWPSEIAKALLGLDIKTIVTTNYDDGIELTLEVLGVSYRVVTFDPQLGDSFLAESDKEADRVTIYKMHGDLDSGNVVLTSGDYSVYAEQRRRMSDKVVQLFREKTFVYFGTSMRDPNLISLFSEGNADLPASISGNKGFALLTTNSAASFDDEALRGIVPVAFQDHREMTIELGARIKRAIELHAKREIASSFFDEVYLASRELAQAQLIAGRKFLNKIEEHRSKSTISTLQGDDTPVVEALRALTKGMLISFKHGFFDCPTENLSKMFERLSHELESREQHVDATRAMEAAWKILPYGKRGAVPERLGRRYMTMGMYSEAFDRFVEGMHFADLNTREGVLTQLRCVRRAIEAINEMVRPLLEVSPKQYQEAGHTMRLHYARIGDVVQSIQRGGTAALSGEAAERYEKLKPMLKEFYSRLAEIFNLPVMFDAYEAQFWRGQAEFVAKGRSA